MSFFARNLKFLRVSKKLTQESLAQAIGMNRGNIASYEKGSAEPSLGNLHKIAKFFDVDIGLMIENDLEELFRDNGTTHENETMEGEVLNSDRVIKDKLILNKNLVEEFKEKSDSMVKILEGFRQFHKFKMESTDDFSDDVKKMSMDYEKLLDVLDQVLKTNKSLIDWIEEN